MLSFLKGSNLFAPHDAASVMRLYSEGLEHKLYYSHPRQTIGKEFADCTWEASSGAENIAKRPSLRLSRHSNGLTRHGWMQAPCLQNKKEYRSARFSPTCILSMYFKLLSMTAK